MCFICHVATDQLDDHHVGYGGNSDWIFGHDSICSAVLSAAQSAALAPQKESPSSLIPGHNNCLANVFL